MHSTRPFPTAPRSSRLAAALLTALFVVAACGGAASSPPTIPSGAVVIHASNLKFDTAQLRVPGDTAFTLAFVNEDGDMHNLAIRTKSGFDGDVVFRFDPVASTTLLLPVPSIPKGSYFFLCEVHPQMNGTVVAY